MAAIDPAEVTSDELGLSWPAATDNNRVIGYRIWLNGYEVATTAETRATLHWFNDDDGQHVVQIKAIDAAGNQSTGSPTLLVARPSPEPTAPDPDHRPRPTQPRAHRGTHADDRADQRADEPRPAPRRRSRDRATEEPRSARIA